MITILALFIYLHIILPQPKIGSFCWSEYLNTYGIILYKALWLQKYFHSYPLLCKWRNSLNLALLRSHRLWLMEIGKDCRFCFLLHLELFVIKMNAKTYLSLNIHSKVNHSILKAPQNLMKAITHSLISSIWV
jgi:hypothetical protein